MSRSDRNFNVPPRSQRMTKLVNVLVTEDELARIDAIGRVLKLPRGRTGVFRAALDCLVDSLTAAELEQVEALVADPGFAERRTQGRYRMP